VIGLSVTTQTETAKSGTGLSQNEPQHTT